MYTGRRHSGSESVVPPMQRQSNAALIRCLNWQHAGNDTRAHHSRHFNQVSTVSGPGRLACAGLLRHLPKSACVVLSKAQCLLVRRDCAAAGCDQGGIQALPAADDSCGAGEHHRVGVLLVWEKEDRWCGMHAIIGGVIGFCAGGTVPPRDEPLSAAAIGIVPSLCSFKSDQSPPNWWHQSPPITAASLRGAPHHTYPTHKPFRQHVRARARTPPPRPKKTNV